MTTNDVFSAAVTAMTHFGDTPFCGDVAGMSVLGPRSISISLDADRQPAAALLAWLGTLDGAEVFTFQSSGRLHVAVAGRRDGINWNLYGGFTGEDAELLATELPDGEHLKPRALVHRLRLVQMRQLARAVAA